VLRKITKEPGKNGQKIQDDISDLLDEIDDA